MSLVSRFISRATDRSDDEEAGELVRTTLGLLFQRHVGDVHRLVSRLLGPGASRADVEDLVQQVFLAARLGLTKFRGDSKASTWLYGITTRTVYKELRGRARQRRMVAALVAAQRTLPQESPGEPHVQARAELMRAWRCLLKINPKKRVVFVLHDIEGMSGQEIAEALKIREGTVHTRLYHARRELLAHLEEDNR